MALDFGIDFGTSNLKVAFFDSERKGGFDSIRIANISVDQGSKFLPNIANVSKEKTRIGRIINGNDETIVRDVKRKIEYTDYEVYVPQRNEHMNILKILSEEFNCIKGIIQDRFGGQEIDKIILTVPVCFSELQKYRMRKAAEEAGFEVDQIIIEPFAGLFINPNTLVDNMEDGSCKRVLVFDAGGGTIDLSVFEIFKDQRMSISVLSSMGMKFGGNDIDDMLYKEVFEKYENIYQKQIYDNFKRAFLDDENIGDEDKKVDSQKYIDNLKYIENKYFYELYANDVIRFKESICCSFDYPDEESEWISKNGEIVSMSYQQFEEMLEKNGVRLRVQGVLNELVEFAMLEAQDIDEIILIGGTSNIPYFHKILSDYFTNASFIELQDDEKYSAVVAGAVSYLENKNYTFEIAEKRIPYEIGMFDGDRYVKVRERTTSVGRPSLKRPIICEQKNGGFKIEVYQLFASTEGKSDEEIKNDAIYVGYFFLKNDRYGYDPRTIQMDISIDERGDIFGRFYNLNDDRYIEDYVEQQRIIIDDTKKVSNFIKKS